MPRPVLLHITTVPMTLGFLRGQLRFMRENGFDVHVMSSPGSDLDLFAAEEDVTAVPVPMQRRITPLRDLVTIARMIRRMRRIRPAVVHASTPKGGLLGAISGRLARTPLVVYHVRGLPYPAASGLQRFILMLTERIACMFAHRVLCVSESVRDLLVADSIAPLRKLHVLGKGSSNGVDALSRFNPELHTTEARRALRKSLGIPDDARVVGFVGRLVRDKGIVELEGAWKSLSPRHPDIRLVLVGPWEERDPVPGDVRARLEDDPHVVLVGSSRDTASYYSIMDMVVLPTYREGFPNVPLEAAAMTLPVIGTRVTGCVDAIVDGVTGTLVEQRDAGALEGAIEVYLERPDLRREHGAAGRARVLRDYEPRLIWRELLSYYRQPVNAE